MSVLSARSDLERAILGACLLEHGAYPAVSDTLDAKNFSIGPHSEIYKAMGKLYPHSPIDLITVARCTRGSISPSYLAELQKEISSSANIRQHAICLVEACFGDGLIKLLDEHINRNPQINRTTHSALRDIIDKIIDSDSDIFDLVQGAIIYVDAIGATDITEKIREYDHKIQRRIQNVKRLAKTESLLANLKSIGSYPGDTKTRVATTTLCNKLLDILATGKVDDTLANKIFAL